MAQSQGSDNLFQASLLALNVVGNIVVVIDDGLHLILVFIREFDSVLNWYPSENHLVLSERPSFIGKNILHSAKLLRTIAVSSDRAVDVIIFVDLIGIE